MIEEFKKRMRYDKLFSFKIGQKESKSINVLMENKYNISAILRKALNDVSKQIELEKILKD
jgi:hypothetical protein